MPRPTPSSGGGEGASQKVLSKMFKHAKFEFCHLHYQYN